MVIPGSSKFYQRLLPNVGSLGLTPLFLVTGDYFKKNINPPPPIYLNLNELTIHIRSICESVDQLSTA